MISEDNAKIAAIRLYETRRAQAQPLLPKEKLVPWEDLQPELQEIYTVTMKNLLNDFEDGWLESV
jgi:hypothetical protein